MKRKVKRSLAGMLALLLTLAVAFPVPVQARETVAEAERILPRGLAEEPEILPDPMLQNRQMNWKHWKNMTRQNFWFFWKQG